MLTRLLAAVTECHRAAKEISEIKATEENLNRVLHLENTTIEDIDDAYHAILISRDEYRAAYFMVRAATDRFYWKLAVRTGLARLENMRLGMVRVLDRIPELADRGRV